MVDLHKIKVILLLTSIILMLLALYMALLYTPTHKDLGDSQRIFYVHVPAGWVAYLGFIIVFICSILYLKSSDRKWDIIAYSAAEIGVMFCTLSLVTGPIWAKAEWGVFWRWEDVKLFMTLVLWLIYLSYVALRSGIESSEQSARLAAVYGILGFICVPLSFTANRIWNQYHPTVIATSEGSLQPVMAYALVVAVLAFTFFYLYFLIKKIELQYLSIKIEELKEILEGD